MYQSFDALSMAGGAGEDAAVDAWGDEAIADECLDAR
jgi:hypothetical protein